MPVFSRLLIVVALASTAAVRAAESRLPNLPETVKFAVIGDNGSGDAAQFDVGRQMADVRKRFAFEFVIMLGDNFYGAQSRDADLRRKFDEPYKILLDAGVRFFASLGNHDDPRTIRYPPLNMNGQRYYTFTRQRVRFFVLDSNTLDAPQVQWFETQLRLSTEPWRIAYFHHPLYSNASRHGSAVDLRVLLEPLLVKYGVSVVLSGHDHSYERIKPQKSIHYFVCGAGGKLRKGGLSAADSTAAGFDADQSFMVVEIAGAEMHFEAISRTGTIVDSGVIHRRPVPGETN